MAERETAGGGVATGRETIERRMAGSETTRGGITRGGTVEREERLQDFNDNINSSVKDNTTKTLWCWLSQTPQHSEDMVVVFD